MEIKFNKIGYIAKDINTKKYIVESITGMLRQTKDIDEATIYQTKETFFRKENIIQHNYILIKVDYGIKILEE